MNLDKEKFFVLLWRQISHQTLSSEEIWKPSWREEELLQTMYFLQSETRLFLFFGGDLKLHSAERGKHIRQWDSTATYAEVQ